MDDETQGDPAEDSSEAVDTTTEAGTESTQQVSSKAPYVEPLAAGKVIHVPIEDIDLDDETFKFRFSLRVGALQESIKRDGQQLPVIVRKLRRHGGGPKYQLISGFRRVTAIKELGWDTVAAMVREDLDDDAAALRASVLENTARKTYSDIDRAYVIQKHLSQGHTSDELSALMCLSKRQIKNLESLTELPAEAQAAIDDPGIKFDTTHALILKRFENVHGTLDWLHWIGRVTTEGLSVSKLTRALNETLKGKAREPVGDVLRGESDLEKGVVRLNPIKFIVADLTDEERAKLRADFERILELI